MNVECIDCDAGGEVEPDPPFPFWKNAENAFSEWDDGWRCFACGFEKWKQDNNDAYTR